MHPRQAAIAVLLLLGVAACAAKPPMMPWAPDVQGAVAIAAARQAMAQSLDPALPRVTFDTWLQGLVGPDAATKWESNDCGEQTGNPELDKGRDFPLCAEAQVPLPGQRALHVSLVVGTFKKGVSGQPAFWAAYLKTPAGTFERIKTLPEIQAAIRLPGRYWTLARSNPARPTYP